MSRSNKQIARNQARLLELLAEAIRDGDIIPLNWLTPGMNLQGLTSKKKMIQHIRRIKTFNKEYAPDDVLRVQFLAFVKPPTEAKD